MRTRVRVLLALIERPHKPTVVQVLSVVSLNPPLSDRTPPAAALLAGTKDRKDESQ